MEEKRNLKKFILIGIIFLIIAGAIGIGISQFIKGPVKKEVKKEREILYYRNPMNPAIRSDRPMKDEMGMDYIPVYEGEEMPSEEPGVFRIPIERVQKIGVTSETVDYRPLKKTILVRAVRIYGEGLCKT